MRVTWDKEPWENMGSMFEHGTWSWEHGVPVRVTATHLPQGLKGQGGQEVPQLQ